MKLLTRLFIVFWFLFSFGYSSGISEDSDWAKSHGNFAEYLQQNESESLKLMVAIASRYYGKDYDSKKCKELMQGLKQKLKQNRLAYADLVSYSDLEKYVKNSALNYQKNYFPDIQKSKKQKIDRTLEDIFNEVCPPKN